MNNILMTKSFKNKSVLKKIVSLRGYLGTVLNSENLSYVLRTGSKECALEVNEYLSDSLVNLIGERVKLRGTLSYDNKIKVISVVPYKPLSLVTENYEDDYSWVEDGEFDFLEKRVRKGYLINFE